MFRLVATALLGYVALRIVREITDTVPDEFGSHLPQQHRRARPKTSPANVRRSARPKSGPTASADSA